MLILQGILGSEPFYKLAKFSCAEASCGVLRMSRSLKFTSFVSTLVCDWLRIDTESHTLMEKLDKTKVKVLEQASNEDGSKTSGTTAASTEVRLTLLNSTATLFILSLGHIRFGFKFPTIVSLLILYRRVLIS